MVKRPAQVLPLLIFRFVLVISLACFYSFRLRNQVFGQTCQNDDGMCFTNCTSENDNDCGQPNTLILTEPVVFGQPDLTETVPNQVVGNRVFHPQGVTIDRGATPNIVYIWDSGNSRILAFSSLGTCEGGSNSGNDCTNDLDCPDSSCNVIEDKKADLILGQPDEFHASCNGDNTQLMPASASTLCSQPYPAAISLMESPGPNNLAVDPYHNLYVFDKWNHRVLRYNDPFSPDKSNGKGDVIADEVWGQEDFVQRGRNRGTDPVDPAVLGRIDRNTFNGGYEGTSFWAAGGVDIDGEGNLWVADVGNHRVLRFPNTNPNGNPQISKDADLVLGQQDFTSREGFGCIGNYDEQIKIPIEEGKELGNWKWYIYPPKNYLCAPKVVRYSPHTGQLFAVDWSSGEGLFRVMIYNPPFRTGMEAEEVIYGSWLMKDDNEYSDVYQSYYEHRIRSPYGLEIDPFVQNAFWIQAGEDRTLYFQKINGKWTPTKVLSMPNLEETYDSGVACSIQDPPHMCKVDGSGGGIGIGSAGNVYLSDLFFQRIMRFPSPIPDAENLNDHSYPADAIILKQPTQSHHAGNLISAYGMKDPGGAILVDYSNGKKQLLVIDGQRILFWNDYHTLSSGSPADGVLFQSDFYSQEYSGDFASIEKDSYGRIWITKSSEIHVFQGPVVSGQTADYVVPGTLPLRFGGTITTSWIAGLAYDESTDALWIADRDNHRVVRIDCPLNVGCQRQVDMVLGQSDLEPHAGYQYQWANRNIDFPFENIDPRCPNMVPDGFGFFSSLKFDKEGNLYITDGIHEGWGCSNNRLLEYDSNDLIPDTEKNFFEQGERTPKRVYGGSGFTAETKNVYRGENIPFTPISVSFTWDNKMLMTVDAYGNPYLKRVFFYDNPLPECAVPCRVEHSSILPIPGSQLEDPSWDNDGNLVILDHTWNRVLLFGVCRNDDSLCPLGCVPENDNDCTPGSGIRGDLDNNGIVDGRDLSILLASWGIPPKIAAADLNSDGAVNSFDFSLVRRAE